MTGSDAIALFKLDAPMTMKELGQRMGCDPSFITTIADALEKHGLARREPSLRDRRSKNIVLTPEGVTVRDKICAELTGRAPWCTALDTGERRCLLGLIRKMLRSAVGGDGVTAAAAASSTMRGRPHGRHQPLMAATRGRKRRHGDTIARSVRTEKGSKTYGA